MADLILHKRSATAAAVPSAGQLELGELAINVADGRLYFKKSSGEIVAVANMTDIWAMQPIGKPFGLWTHLAGVSVPPTDNPNYRYIKLTASDSYNTGVLTSESVSGSAPLVQATAVINLAGSPINGQTVRLINTERRAIRAGSSGSVESDAMQGHFHDVVDSYFSNGGGAGGVFPANVNLVESLVTGAPISDGTNGTPRVANETRMKNIGADYYMRIR